MKVLGIHDGHNASVCLTINGEIKGLLQEERLKNQKNFSGFPVESLLKLLEINSLTLENIDVFAFNGHHVANSHQREQTLENYKNSYSLKAKFKHLVKKTPIYGAYKKNRKASRTEWLISKGVSPNKIRFVEHHLAHAATTFFGSNWAYDDEEVLILTQDGSGDDLSATVSIGSKGRIRRIASINKEDSLGRIYATVTYMLGMVPLEHEYKLMGMAPYAPENGMVKSYKVFEQLLEFDNKEGLTWKRKSGLPPMQQIYPHIRKMTELHRFDWIAAGLQKFTEDMLVQWVSNAVKKTGIRKIALSGGTFMNVKANQKISEMTEVEEIFVFPTCGDETNAIGVAWQVNEELKPGSNREFKHLYYGPDENDDENVLSCIHELEKKGTVEFTYYKPEQIEEHIAKLLAKGEIVARCKGNMEFGSRALGNRSILSDASDLNKVMVINNMIKKRDFWMPFAPVILKERQSDYIINNKKIDAPYMIITMNSTEKYREFIGGVQQVDKTARPQLIDGTRNPDYYRLLKEYEKLTGRGVLINTSFNLHGLPIVYGPKEALFVFENSGLQNLAVGNFLVTKSTDSQKAN